jgi:hypothetical protein
VLFTLHPAPILPLTQYSDSFARRLRDAEAVISTVSQQWSHQRQALSSEHRRQMKIRHSPIIEQVTSFAIHDVVQAASLAGQVQSICFVTTDQSMLPAVERQSTPPLFDSCRLAPSSIEAISKLRAAHTKWLQERGVIVAVAPISSMAYNQVVP